MGLITMTIITITTTMASTCTIMAPVRRTLMRPV
jgi:hypothetical protein